MRVCGGRAARNHGAVLMLRVTGTGEAGKGEGRENERGGG